MTSPSPSPPPVSLRLTPASSAYLDFWRAAAANIVVLAHLRALFDQPAAGVLTGGLAVVVFFLLSGFLIAGSLARRAASAERGFAPYLADRAARILTPLVPALCLIGLVTGTFSLPAVQPMPGISDGPWAFLGNLAMLQDYPLFQALEVMGHGVDWRIRPYLSAEPWWTVAIEFWFYAGFGWLFFVFMRREPTGIALRWALPLVALPVLVWHAGTGPGRALTLVWITGAVIGLACGRLAHASPAQRSRIGLAVLVLAGMGLALHAKKFGFDAYEFQTAVLTALLLFAPVLLLQQVTRVPRLVDGLCRGLTSYSYSLYLVHNTVLALVWNLCAGRYGPQALVIGWLGSHVAAIVMYWAFERHYPAVARWMKRRLGPPAMAGDSARPAEAVPR